MFDELTRLSLDDDPFKQFDLWYRNATTQGITEPGAMSLATSDASGVSLRTVLLKYFDHNGFVFFTNYHSRKAKQIASNPQVALLFTWISLERQVKISGRAEKISTLASAKYFSSRPKDSQLGAWASHQSSHLLSRTLLISQFEAMKKKFKEGEVPLPDFWGGYRVVPQIIEFWQAGKNRLHDRFEYTREGDSWEINRLAP